MHRFSRKDNGKTLNPRQRRKRQQWLNEGIRKTTQRLFQDPADHETDMQLLAGVLRVRGYRIPKKAYRLAVEVPCELAEDESREDKIRLRAASLIRAVIKDAKEMELIDAEIEAIKNEGNKETVILREDEGFFDNDAHAQPEPTQEHDATTQRESEEGTDQAGPAA